MYEVAQLRKEGEEEVSQCRLSWPLARREDDEEEPDGKDEEGRRMITLRTVYGYDTLEHANAITIIKAPARYIHGDVTNPTREK